MTQKHEECSYTEITIDDTCSPITFLKEHDDGCLDSYPTSILEYVGGNSLSTKIITINLKDVKTTECQEAGFDNTTDTSKSHTDNVFNTAHLPIKPVNSKLFGSIIPVKIVSQTDSQLVLDLQFPYEAKSKWDMFSNYLFGGKHIQFPIIIQTCRYIRTPVIKMYADIEWFLGLSVGSSEAFLKTVSGMPNLSDEKDETYAKAVGKAYEIMQVDKDTAKEVVSTSNRNATTYKEAIKAGQNRHALSQNNGLKKDGSKRKWLTANAYFELKLNAKYNNNEETPVVSAKYEQQIRQILVFLFKVKEKVDSFTHVEKLSAPKIQSKLMKKLGKIPFDLKVDYPVIEIKGSWKYGQNNNGEVVREGSIEVGFNPLIKAEGSIDLIACSSYIPYVGPIIKALDIATEVGAKLILNIDVDIWLDIYAIGEVSATGTVSFNKEEVIDLKGKASLAFGIRLGVAASTEIKKASFFSSTGENLTKDSEENALGKAGFEVSAKGEAKFSTELKAGLDSTGMYIQASAGFDGLNATFTAMTNHESGSIGINNKVYTIMDAIPNILTSNKKYILKT